MAPADGSSTLPGQRLGLPWADGVSRVLTGLAAQLAHTMALCGLTDVRDVPRDTVARAR